MYTFDLPFFFSLLRRYYNLVFLLQDTDTTIYVYRKKIV